MARGKKQDEQGEDIFPPRAYSDTYYPWSYRRLPKDHPARTRAVFVVHGIGLQTVTETSATLRAGFEDALEEVREWQEDQKEETLKPFHKTNLAKNPYRVPPPFTYDGHWADYANIETTFPEDWKQFNPREKTFFSNLWRAKTVKPVETYFWFVKQQLGLLNPKTKIEIKMKTSAYLLYWLLVPTVITSLTVSLFRFREVLIGYLSDVRLYVDPKGMVERAIVQRIDYRVGKAFLKMLDLDWNFRPIKESSAQLDSSGIKPKFERIVWVCHSLGTVISYNVISDLCARAGKFEKTGDPDQKKGVKKFYQGLRRFVTLGSPLDKIGYLFGNALRPWPKNSEKIFGPLPKVKPAANPDPKAKSAEKIAGPTCPWWVNFYSGFDPVSGSLDNPTVCNIISPVNLHIQSGMGFIPGFSHASYWKDTFTLRYILSRTYGREHLFDREYKPLPMGTLKFLMLLAYLFWVILAYAVIIGVLFLIAWALKVGIWEAFKIIAGIF